MRPLYLAMLCLLVDIVLSNKAKAQYPYLPQNTQKYINGTIGEERGGRNRYHYGLDFAAPDGSNVYCIETGPLRKKDGASFAIGTYGYIHVERNANTNAANGTIIKA
jgi:murein DD-endopeptidase MepM/ murein hydrolase activator NlpD